MPALAAKPALMTVALAVGAISVGVLAHSESAMAASLVDIDLTNGVFNNPPGPLNIFYSFENIGGTGVDLTVRGGDENGNSRAVSLDNVGLVQGLGVFGGGGDNTDVDGAGPDERIIFEFSEIVTLLQGTFLNSVGPNIFNDGDEVALSTDAFPAFNPIQASSIPGSNIVSFGGIASNNFVFGPTDIDDDFIISSLQVEVAEAVPTPALLPGLIGMGAAVLRKRRKAAEALETA